MNIPAVSFDLSDWSQIVITGDQRVAFLQSFCTNDIVKLRPGQGCEAFIPDIKGRILGHLLVYNETNSLRMVSVPRTGDTIATHLRKYLLGNDAEVIDRSESYGLLCLAGEDISDVIQLAFAVSLPEEIGSHVTVSIDDEAYLVARSDMTPMPTVLISGLLESVERLRDSWPDEVVAIGSLELFDQLRIEAGFPWHGRDISADNIAQEAARTDRAISFTKGCYLGQEPIARLDAMGHTNKELRRLDINGVGATSDSAVRLNDQDVGVITSISSDPSSERSVALAMIRSKANAPGTQLKVVTDGAELTAVVHSPS